MIEELRETDAPITANTIREKVHQRQGKATTPRITSQSLPAQAHEDTAKVRAQQAHILAVACRTATQLYCKTMGYNIAFPKKVYNMVLSAARNLEAQEMEGHDEANFRKRKKGKDVARGTYICQHCCTAREAKQSDTPLTCQTCQQRLVWYADVQNVEELLATLASQDEAVREAHLIASLETQDANLHDLAA